MPFNVLVALALALTSAVAFAAHYVYTTYVAPQQQGQQVSQDDLVSVSESATTTESEYVDVLVVDTETVADGSGEIEAVWEYEYDEEGRISRVAQESHDGDGSVAYATYTCSYKADDLDGFSPSFSLESQEGFTASTLPELEEVYNYEVVYDDYGNIVSAYESNYQMSTTFNYKKISVKAGEWVPNPYSNPTLGAGSLSNYRLDFIYYILTENRIEQVMTANENESE